MAVKLVQLDDLTKNNIEQYRIVLGAPLSLGSQTNSRNKSNSIEKIEIDTKDSMHKLGYFQDLMVGGISFKKKNAEIIVTHANVLMEYKDLQVWEALVGFVVEFGKTFESNLLDEKPVVIKSELPLMGFTKNGDFYEYKLEQ